MSKLSILILCFILLNIGALFGQLVSVNFRDAMSSPLTQATLNPECQAQFGQNYTFTFPLAANRWKFQWYKDGGDGVISPLAVDGTPTGDDIIANANTGPTGNTTGIVNLGPTQLWTPNAAVFEPLPYGTNNTVVGDRIFVRIFNANTITAATKSIAFTALYTITSDLHQLIMPYIPTYAWGPWTNFRNQTPSVSNYPQDGANNIFYQNLMLQWTFPAAMPEVSSFDVYLDITQNPTTYVGSAVNLYYNIPSLQPMTTYHWFVRYTLQERSFSDSPIWTFTTGDAPLPVVLSTFNATLTAQRFVSLTWVTESETQLLGYNVLRSEASDLSTAQQMNADIITATNTSQQCTYNHLDMENLQAEHVYNYWLQSVNLDGGIQYYGPVSVTVTGAQGEDPVPIIPTYTKLLSSYPNPFQSLITIPYVVKSGGTVKIDIYNVKGELIWQKATYCAKAGTYTQNWNGRDLQGREVSSGTYICHMVCGTYSGSQKLLLMK